MTAELVKQYVKTVDEDSFDPVRLDLYWRFVAERQRVYVRRTVLKLAPPWTADEIIRDEFITNMYRELDPGTQYVRDELIGIYDPVDLVFNVMMYRLMGSNAEAHRLVASDVADYDPQKFIDTLREHAREFDMKVFGDAYRVAAYHDEGGEDKIENVGRLFAKFRDQMPEIMRRLKAASSTKDAFEVFKGLSGLGEFLAHQITVDLLYDPDTLPFGEDEWAQAGPGARNGIWALLRPEIKPSNLLIVMRWLRENQREQFEKRDLEFPYLVDDDGEEVELSLCNIQSTLCEYYKYVRIWSGETKGAVRKYDPTARTETTGPGVALEDLDHLRDLVPALTLPRPVPVTAAPEPSLGVDERSAEEDLRPVAGWPPVEPQSFEVTAPDGRAVTINITFNFSGS